MKKHAGGLSAAAFLTCLMSGGALAGGLAPAVPEPEPAPPALQVSNPFLGSYGGVSLGYVFNGDDEVGIRPPGGASTRIGDLDLSGALAGLHGGYRWQMRRLTVGVELGLVGGDVKDDFSTQGGEASSELKYALSLRGSSGILINPATLVYSFAGVAHGKFDYRAVGNGGTIENDFSATGYLVGLGVERAIGENWSVRGEYQYTNYGSEELTDPAGFSTKATPQDHRLSLGLLWRF